MDEKLELLANAFGVTPDEITGGSSTQHLARLRWALMYYAATQLGWPQTRIGDWLGRNHTTISHGLRRARELVETDQEFRIMTSWVNDDRPRNKTSRAAQLFAA